MGLFSWFNKNKQTDTRTAYQRQLAEMPKCWIVYPFNDEDGNINPPSRDTAKLEHTDGESYCTLHYEWEPKNQYDCGGFISGGNSMENIYRTEAEADEAYAECMVKYANALVNKGFLLLCEYSEDK